MKFYTHVATGVTVAALQNEGGFTNWFEMDKFIHEDIFPYIMNPADGDTLHLLDYRSIRKGDWVVRFGMDLIIYPDDEFQNLYKELT